MEPENIGQKKRSRRLLPILIILFLVIGIGAMLIVLGLKPAENLLVKTLSEPSANVNTAKVIIDVGDGNLIVDGLASNEQTLMNGNLEYFETIGEPTTSVQMKQDLTIVSLKANGGQPWKKLPWSACNGPTMWEIHLNPSISVDITTHSDGGNVRLDLAGMSIANLETETGGGNMEILLPDNAENLDVLARVGAGRVTIIVGNNLTGINSIIASSGAGEMTVVVPDSVAARVNVVQGQANVSSAFIKIDDVTYETADYLNATDKVEITISSDAGKVNITTGINLES